MEIKKIIRNVQTYAGKVLNLTVNVVELDNGNIATREFINRKEVVAILALTENGDIVLVEQDRYNIGPMVELPAGLVNKDEILTSAALRELKEETGYTARDIKHISTYYSSVGFTDEIIHLFIARDLVKGEQSLDINEDITVKYISIEDLERFIKDKNNKIDSKILTAYAYLRFNREV